MSEIGCSVAELAPGRNNPRNSEGAFLQLKDGGLLFCFSRFEGDSHRDDAHADLARMISHDGGLTWSAPEIFLTARQAGAMNLMSVSMLRLRSGRIVPASALHPSDGSTDYGVSMRASVCVHYSDDDGITWRRSLHSVLPADPKSGSGLQEPGLLELADGRLWGWARTDLGRQYEFFSRDDGITWSAAQPSAFTSPCSPMSVRRSPYDGSLLAVWNPLPPKTDGFGWGRERLAPTTAGAGALPWCLKTVPKPDFATPPSTSRPSACCWPIARAHAKTGSA